VSFQHEALFHAGDDGFLAGTVPFVREGLERDEPVLVAVGRRRQELMQAALGQAAAAAVAWIDMPRLGRNPARIIPAWRAFVDGHGGRAARGIGEPVWAGRTDDELCECHRHEALLNTAFDEGPSWRLRCPYDLHTLPDDQLREAARTHPVVVEHGLPLRSPAYHPPERASAAFDGELPPPPGRAEALTVREDGLAGARAAAGRHAEAAGLEPVRSDDLCLAVTELATNAIVHGGGPADVRLWQEPGQVVCQVTGGSPLGDPLTGRRRPPADVTGGWGLYLVNQLCDLVQIRSDHRRTVVRVRMAC
jgi:anti-sigma regulatory factor (Ser/Thr protein kinase)